MKKQRDALAQNMGKRKNGCGNSKVELTKGRLDSTAAMHWLYGHSPIPKGMAGVRCDHWKGMVFCEGKCFRFRSG